MTDNGEKDRETLEHCSAELMVRLETELAAWSLGDETRLRNYCAAASPDLSVP